MSSVPNDERFRPSGKAPPDQLLISSDAHSSLHGDLPTSDIEKSVQQNYYAGTIAVAATV
jgi:hypothetical protein